MRRVLDGGRSDHDPFVCTFTTGFGARFTAVTYNAAKHPAVEIESVLKRILDHDVSIWLLQEIKGRSIGRWLKRRGFGYRRVDPEFAIGWDGSQWEYLRHWRPLMSPTEYWTFNYALVVVLRHRRTGLVGKFISYHPPAHVQAPRHPTFPKVSRVLREWKVTLDRLARRRFARSVEKAGGIDFVLAGGDDNVDESRGWSPAGGWDFMLSGPLEQVQAPSGTHGARKIDDFRVRGAKVAG